ncbi:MAG: hypothetical protein ACO1O1_08420 [Adhaeribacter sp.]
MIYLIITVLGFISLRSPDEQIGDPFFTLMEILILLIAPSAAVSLIGIHFCSSPKNRIFSFISLSFMLLVVGISSCVHFAMLTLSHQPEFNEIPAVGLVFSFQWPSVFYALDILAWDWFYALSLLFLAPIFKGGGLNKLIKVLIIISGVLCLAGLIGIPLHNMQVRNIGIVGYGVIAPFIFLLMAIKINRNASWIDEK